MDLERNITWFFWFGHIQPFMFIVVVLFRSSSIVHFRRCDLFGHVQIFQSYSFGHVDLVKWLFLCPASISGHNKHLKILIKRFFCQNSFNWIETSFGLNLSAIQLGRFFYQKYLPTSETFRHKCFVRFLSFIISKHYSTQLRNKKACYVTAIH